MGRKVTLVEVNVYKKMVPLVSGYLQAYACKDPLLRDGCDFVKHTTTTDTALTQIVYELGRQKSEVYAFSCYVWNTALVRAILPTLIHMNPESYFLLGGPQVMHHAEKYLDPQHERLMLCNGEGERTFTNFLRQLTHDRPDFSGVRGLSFYKNGTLTTTEPEERIRDLDEIPSPFLNGLFDDSYVMSILETNRGCPFKCGFCFWGAANNDRVFKFSEERIREELSWISRNATPYLFIADANWGMLKRDIELSRHIAQCKQQYDLPAWVYVSAAKNSPGRVTEICRIFSDAGLLNYQPISMQSMDTAALEAVDRSNIKLTAYETLQMDLNERGISSFLELIWPLPGETLATYRRGLEALMERKVGAILVYPHLLLHNTTLYKKRAEYGLVTRAVQDDIAEMEVVVQTAEVDFNDFREGLWFYYMVLALHNTRSLPGLSHYLHANGLMTYRELYERFADFCKAEEQHPFTRYCRQSIDEMRFLDMTDFPLVYHLTLHDERGAFETLLYQFASAQTWWDDDEARSLFELDMLRRPFIYSNTPFESSLPLENTKILESSDRSYVVEVPERCAPLLDPSAKNGDSGKTSVFRVDHKGDQHPFASGRDRRILADYCHGRILTIAKTLPRYTRVV